MDPQKNKFAAQDTAVAPASPLHVFVQESRDRNVAAAPQLNPGGSGSCCDELVRTI